MPEFLRKVAIKPLLASDSKLYLALIVSIFLGLHTNIAISSGARVIVPCAVSGLAAAILILLRWADFRRLLLAPALVMAAALLVFAVSTSVSDGAIVDRILSSALLWYSFILAAGLGLGMRALDAKVLSGAFLKIAVILIVCAILEVLGPLRPISDAFRSFVRPWGGVYTSDLRDVMAYGGVRPKAFASEPAGLGFTIALCLFLWFASVRPRSALRSLQFISLSVAAFAVTRTPVTLFAIAAGGVYVAFYDGRGRLRSVATRMVCFVCCVSMLFLLPMTWLGVRQEVPELKYVATGSFFARQIAPMLVAKEAMSSRPLFGYGVGGDEEITPLVRDVYGNEGTRYNTQAMSSGQTNTLITNAFWSFWAYLGLLGGGAILILSVSTLRRLGDQAPLLPLAAASLFGQTLGAINLPAIWCVLFAVSAAVTHRAMNASPREPLTEARGAAESVRLSSPARSTV